MDSNKLDKTTFNLEYSVDVKDTAANTVEKNNIIDIGNEISLNFPMNKNIYPCDMCQKTFSSTPSLYRHKNHSCKNNPNKTPRNDIIKISEMRKSKNITNGSHHIISLTSKITSFDALDKDNTEHVIKEAKEQPTFHAVDIIDIIDIIDKENRHLIKKTSTIDMMDTIDIQGQQLIKKLDTRPINSTDNTNVDKSELISDLRMLFQQELGNKIEKIVSKLDKNHKPQTNYFNIEKIQIFMTDPIDFVEVLTKRLGSRKLAIEFIKSKIHKKLEGDVDMFCAIYLHGEPDTWPISCLDKKNHVYRIAQKDSTVISDPGGLVIHKSFRNNYSNTLLRLNNSYIFETLSKEPGTEEFEKSRDELLDTFDLSAMQDKALSLTEAACDPFTKKLSIKLKTLEKAFELNNGV